MKNLAEFIRDVPDFPKEGIIFKDITPLVGDAAALREACRLMAEPFRGRGVTKCLGAEARGFIFATGVGLELGAGVVPVRKPGKLPAETTSVTYDLEYGTDTLEIHTDAVGSGDKVLLVDDLLATGGTIAGCANLIRDLGAEVVGATFLIELAFLKGRDKLDGLEVSSLIVYDAE